MRILISALFALALLDATAQKEPVIIMPYDTASQMYAYTEVVELADLPPSVLYKNARTWLFDNNGDTTWVDAVVDMKLVDRGVLPVNVVMDVGMVKMPMTYNVIYSIALEFKDGRYRYTINKFSIGGDGTVAAQGMALETYVKQHESMKMGKKIQIEQEEQLCAALDVEVKKLIETMRSRIKTPKKTDDW